MSRFYSSQVPPNITHQNFDLTLILVWANVAVLLAFKIFRVSNQVSHVAQCVRVYEPTPILAPHDQTGYVMCFLHQLKRKILFFSLSSPVLRS